MIEPPKINLLYYKHILDVSLERFADDFDRDFTRNAKTYVFSKNTEKKILRVFREYVIEEIMKYTSEYDISKPRYYFIISSCYPKDNILKKHIDKDKLTEDMNGQIKYILSESDIKIDDSMFNSVFETIGDELLDRRKMHKYFGNRCKNIFFLRNDSLDCYFTYRLIRDIYGKVNVINMFKENEDEFHSNFVSINEMIDSKLANLKDIIRGEEMKPRKEELREYIEMCIRGEVK